MTPLMISLISFVAVATVVGLVAFVMRDTSTTTAERLDTLVGKRGKGDPGADILKKTAFESDKKSFLEAITPNLPSLQKILEQADAHIKVSTLFGIGMLLAVLGATGSWLARVPWFFAPLAGLVAFVIPLLCLLYTRRELSTTFALHCRAVP